MIDIMVTVSKLISYVFASAGGIVVEEGIKETTKKVVGELNRKLNGNVDKIKSEEMPTIVAATVEKTLDSIFEKKLVEVKNEHMIQLIKEEVNQVKDTQNPYTKEIIKYYMDIDKIEKKIDDTYQLDREEEDKTDIELYFNRSLTEEEKRSFLNTDSLINAYDDEAMEFSRLEIGDDYDSARIEFLSEGISRFEVARFSLFIDKYLRDISYDLCIKSIVMMKKDLDIIDL